MTRYERFANGSSTTLSGAMTDSQTSMSVADGTVFPDEGDFRVVASDEIMICTARTGNTLTVIRGQEGTTAVSHSNGDDVAGIVTKGGLEKYVTDFIDPFATLRPPNRLLSEAGVVLTTSSFTTANLGTGGVTNSADGSITMDLESRAEPNISAIYRTAPSTPYTITAHVLTHPVENDLSDTENVLGFQESSSSKISYISYGVRQEIVVKYLADYNDATGAPADQGSVAGPPRADWWLRIEDNGTNLTYRASHNGYNWFEIHTETRGTWFTTGPDRVFWGGDCQGDTGEILTLMAWIEA